MISFIVIGRNEGWKLTKCLQSITETIENNQLKNWEIIYIDSTSTDDSIERAKTFNKTKIFIITGKYNAAIARNIGAKEASGNVLFFIDGDMQIRSDFLPLIYNEDEGLFDDFVSGQFINYNYDYNGNLISRTNYFNSGIDKIVSSTGGLFLIKKDLWKKVNGMKCKLRRSQDVDLGIRLAGIGVFLKRKKELLAIHHTVSYHNQKRTWEMLLSGSEFYRSVLLRDNFFNYYQWKLFLRENYSSIALMFLLLIYFKDHSPLIIIIYFTIILLRAIRKKEAVLTTMNLFVYYFARDLMTWFSLFFFWPSNKIELLYEEIQ